MNVEELWQDFHGELLAFARRRVGSDSEAEDILQAAFLRAHHQLESGTKPANARGWLYQIVRNLAIDTYRQKARHRETTEPQANVDLEAVKAPSAFDVGEDTHAVVARALPMFIERLKRPYREALQLTEIQGLTQAQAAARVGISLSGMKSRVQRARKQLLEALLECCEFGLDVHNRVAACNTREAEEVCCSSSGPCDDAGVGSLD